MGTRILTTLSCVLLSSAPLAAGEGQLFLRGDANGDGFVDIADVLAINAFALLGSPATCTDALDVDDNGKIDPSDIASLAVYVLTGEASTAPADPGPRACGRDPTDDDLAECVYEAERCESPERGEGDPVLRLQLVGPLGNAERPRELTVLCRLHSQGLPSGLPGLVAWTFGVSVRGARVLEARMPAGTFESVRPAIETSILDGTGVIEESEQSEAVAAVILSMVNTSSLGPNHAPHDLLELRLEVEVMEGNCRDVTIELTEELSGNDGTVLPVAVYGIHAEGVFSLTAAAKTFSICDSPVFRRGDVDGSSDLNLTDPISLLSFLFSGGPGPDCLDAADANDDERLDLSDAIYILSFLMLGGPEPPFPGTRNCGSDIGDRLGCERTTCESEDL